MIICTLKLDCLNFIFIISLYGVVSRFRNSLNERPLLELF